ncbi:MAG: YggT family protein [Pseudomonadota bacterium]|nr:YggT family protein [Pseudomonadota bacterium]MED5423214.1 YggT family protein [Pseudomonadota bacterium]MEE3322955.1 YggT family protein [Pseudomonadota bacterium]|tara:strand:- start:1924 stop:2220 length:297 start_codon:yes stop_codon:yes gene_type:complete
MIAGLLNMLIGTAISIYITIIIIEIIIHWLIAFEVIKARSPQAQNLISLLSRLTSPVMEKVRKYVPPIGGLDLTPIVVIIGLQIISYIITRILMQVPI